MRAQSTGGRDWLACLLQLLQCNSDARSKSGNSNRLSHPFPALLLPSRATTCVVLCCVAFVGSKFARESRLASNTPTLPSCQSESRARTQQAAPLASSPMKPVGRSKLTTDDTFKSREKTKKEKEKKSEREDVNEVCNIFIVFTSSSLTTTLDVISNSHQSKANTITTIHIYTRREERRHSLERKQILL